MLSYVYKMLVPRFQFYDAKCNGDNEQQKDNEIQLIPPVTLGCKEIGRENHTVPATPVEDLLHILCC